MTEAKQVWHSAHFAAAKAKNRGKGKWTITAAVPGIMSRTTDGKPVKLGTALFTFLADHYVPGSGIININHFQGEMANFGVLEAVRVVDGNLEADIKIREKWLNNLIENNLHSGFSLELLNLAPGSDGVEAIAADLHGLAVALPPAVPRCPKGSCDIVGFCAHPDEIADEVSKEGSEKPCISKCGCDHPCEGPKCCKEIAAKEAEAAKAAANFTTETSEEKRMDPPNPTPPAAGAPPPAPENKQTQTQTPTQTPNNLFQQTPTQVVSVEEIEVKHRMALKAKEDAFIAEKQRLEAEVAAANEARQRLAQYEAKERAEVIASLPKFSEDDFRAIGAKDPAKGWDNYDLTRLREFKVLQVKTAPAPAGGQPPPPEGSGIAPGLGVKHDEKQPTPREQATIVAIESYNRRYGRQASNGVNGKK